MVMVWHTIIEACINFIRHNAILHEFYNPIVSLTTSYDVSFSLFDKVILEPVNIVTPNNIHFRKIIFSFPFPD